MFGLLRLARTALRLRSTARLINVAIGREFHWKWYVVKNDIPKVMALVEANAVTAVKRSAEQIAGDARSRAPVQTGHLRSSIYATTYGKEADIRADAEYAAYVEYGTYKARAQPFLSPAVEAHKDEFFDDVGFGAFRRLGA